jgi:ABC-2 type transport system permease protein
MIRLLALRELRSLFAQPATWWILALMQFVFAWFFLSRTEYFLEIQPQLAQLASPPGATLTVAVPLFNILALLLMMMTPLFTMRLIAEERRNQTFALLLSAPISSAQILIGKCVGLLLFLLLWVIAAPLMVSTLALGTHLDSGLIFSNLLGLILLTISFIAVGTYFSALTAQPIIAAIGALVVLIGLWLADLLATSDTSPWHIFSPMHHFQNFNNGLLSTEDAAFFVLFSAAFLILAWRKIQQREV